MKIYKYNNKYKLIFSNRYFNLNKSIICTIINKYN